MNVHDHALLVACGYTITHVEAFWEDVGDPENGPDLQGNPAYTEAVLGDHFIIVIDDRVVDSGTDPYLLYHPEDGHE